MRPRSQKRREAREYSVREGWHFRPHCRTLSQSHDRQVV
jgi:hypothetical protein